MENDNAILCVPDEPLEAKFSSSVNFHRLTLPTPSVLVLAPGYAAWWIALALLAVAGVVYAACLAWGLEGDIRFFVASVFLFGSAIHVALGFCLRFFATRARFDRCCRQMHVTGLSHGRWTCSWDDIKALQFCHAGERGCCDSAWQAFQLNLVVGAELRRVVLLENGGRKQLFRMARNISLFLGVPLYVDALPWNGQGDFE